MNDKQACLNVDVPSTNDQQQQQTEGYDDGDADTNVDPKLCSERQKFHVESINTHEDGTRDTLPDMSIRMIWFNLIVFCSSFLLLFAAFLSFANLQSTLNQADGLGTIGMTVIYVSMILTSITLPPLILSKFPLKWIGVVSMVTYLGYLATGFYPSWGTIIPASVLIGSGGALLWTVNSVYLTNLAKIYATKTNKDASTCISQFFGVFFFVFCSTHVWGNLFSSLVLQTDKQNSSSFVDDNKQCGADFCPNQGDNQTVIVQPSISQVYTYTSICLSLGVIAALGMAVFIKDLPHDSGQGHVKVKDHLKEVLAFLFTDNRQHLLIITTIYRGMAQGFMMGDFTIAFVSCPLGVDNVGFVMMAYGTVGALSSFIYGKISAKTGLYPLFCLAFLVQTSACIVMLLWQPDKSQTGVIFVLAGMWAVGDAVFLSLVTVMYSLFFKDRMDSALSCFRLLDSLGWAVAFGYSAFLCTSYKIYIIQTILVLSHVFVTVFFVRYDKMKWFKACTCE